MSELKSQKEILHIEELAKQKPWIGVDYDGTMVTHPSFVDPNDHGGKVVPKMRDRVVRWCMQGRRVKIMTARAANTNPNREQDIAPIRQHLKDNYPEVCHNLEITAEKDYGMIELWDDRAIGIIRDTGERADGEV